MAFTQRVFAPFASPLPNRLGGCYKCLLIFGWGRKSKLRESCDRISYNHSDHSLSNHRIIIVEIDQIMNGQKMAQITSTELPQTLQTLFIEVERTKTPLTIIHEGKPLVIIYPANTEVPRPTFGAMRGSGEILGDLIAPVAEPWEVLE